MKKAYEKNDVSSAKRSFAYTYIVIMIVALYITDIIKELSDISLDGITAIRSIICFAAVLVLARYLTKYVINKYKISKPYADNLRFNINLIIIAVAFLSLFYFLITVKSNINTIKDSTEYRMYAMFSSKSEADDIIKTAEKEARKSFIIVWISIMTASAIAVGLEGKTIDHYCYEEPTYYSNENDDTKYEE